MGTEGKAYAASLTTFLSYEGYLENRDSNVHYLIFPVFTRATFLHFILCTSAKLVLSTVWWP